MVKVVASFRFNSMIGGFAVFILMKLVDVKPHLLNSQSTIVTDALEGKVASTLVTSILTTWAKSSTVDEVFHEHHFVNFT